MLLCSVFVGVAHASQYVGYQLANLKVAAVMELDSGRRAAIKDSVRRLEALGDVPDGRLVVVNIPAFEVTLWENDQPIESFRAIVGQPGTPTPQFQSEITAAIANPWWHVPASIVRESVGELMRKRPAVARARGFVRRNGGISQKPGPQNALGQVKLVVSNPYRIGMHDTPNRELFSEDRRAFSHGCIRIQDIGAFADRLLEETPGAPAFEDIIVSGKTRTVTLLRPVPVIVGYFLAEAKDGEVRIFDDIYGRLGANAASNAPETTPQANLSAGCA